VDTLSELGRTGGGGRDIFNAGVILASLLWVPFALMLIAVLPKCALSRLGGALFLLSAASLLAIGIFPIDAGIPHTVASWSFFIMSLASLLLLVVPMAKSEIFGRLATSATLAAPLVSMAFLAFTSVPLAEAVAVICLMAWAAIVSATALRGHGDHLRL
jgi:hypothetical membrane protein